MIIFLFKVPHTTSSLSILDFTYVWFPPHTYICVPVHLFELDANFRIVDRQPRRHLHSTPTLRNPTGPLPPSDIPPHPSEPPHHQPFRQRLWAQYPSSSRCFPLLPHPPPPPHPQQQRSRPRRRRPYRRCAHHTRRKERSRT
jgi:hypothetical protein